MEELKKFIMKKKKEKGEMSPIQSKAKSNVLEDLMDQMGGLDAEKIKGVKKVTVASNSPDGVKKGLDKAKEMVSELGLGKDEESVDNAPEIEPLSEGEMEDLEAPGHEGQESVEEELSEHESPDEIEAKIKELQAKLNSLRS